MNPKYWYPGLWDDTYPDLLWNSYRLENHMYKYTLSLTARPFGPLFQQIGLLDLSSARYS